MIARGVLLGYLLAAALLGAHAQAAEYLIASLIGDRLTISHATMTTGSSIDRNQYQYLKVPTLPFDDAIQNAIAEAVLKADPQATFKGLAFREGLPGVEALDKEEPKELAKKLVQVLGPALKPGQRQWIVALWPVRAEPQFKLADMYVGRGRAAGLGFYVDRWIQLVRRDTGERDEGFLGAFAHFVVAIIDPSTQAVVAQQKVEGTVLCPMAGSGKGHPWELMKSEEKLEYVNQLVARELKRAVPGLMASVAR